MPSIPWLLAEPAGSLLHSLLITCLSPSREPWGWVPSTYNSGIAKPHLCIHLALRLLSLWPIINQARDMKNIYMRRCCIFFGSCPHINCAVYLAWHLFSSAHLLVGKGEHCSPLSRSTFLIMRIAIVSPRNDLFLRRSKLPSLQSVFFKHLNSFCCSLLFFPSFSSNVQTGHCT